MPPVTAVMAWFVLGDTLSARELVGLVVGTSRRDPAREH